MSGLRLPAVTAFGPELLQQAFDALTSWHNSGGQFPVSATPPANPAAGDFWIYQGSGFYWQFIYDSSETTYKWKFVGGGDLMIDTGAVSVQLNGMTQVGATGFWYPGGSVFAVPRAGDWEISGVVSLDPNGAGGFCHVAPYSGATIPSFSASLGYFYVGGGGAYISLHNSYIISGVTAGASIGLAATSATPGTNVWAQGHWLIRPRRVS